MYIALRNYRKKNNISVKTLAELIQVDVCNYYRREQGKIEFSLEEIKKICNYLNIGLDVFVK